MQMFDFFQPFIYVLGNKINLLYEQCCSFCSVMQYYILYILCIIPLDVIMLLLPIYTLRERYELKLLTWLRRYNVPKSVHPSESNFTVTHPGESNQLSWVRFIIHSFSQRKTVTSHELPEIELMFEQYSNYWVPFQMQNLVLQYGLHTFWIGHSSMTPTSLLLINRTQRLAGIGPLTERLSISASGALDHYTTDVTYTIVQFKLAV